MPSDESISNNIEYSVDRLKTINGKAITITNKKMRDRPIVADLSKDIWNLIASRHVNLRPRFFATMYVAYSNSTNAVASKVGTSMLDITYADVFTLITFPGLLFKMRVFTPTLTQLFKGRLTRFFLPYQSGRKFIY